MTPTITLGRRVVGLEHPTYFVADIAANHDGDLGRARKLIALAADAGADAAKFQNFRAETIVSDQGFQELGGQRSHQVSWRKSVVEVYRDAALPLEWTDALKAACGEHGLDYFTAPYDLNLIKELSPHVCAWKVGSGDITWLDELDRLARDGKPVLLATGASSMDEVREAVATLEAHTTEIVVMQCNTNYTGARENFQYVNLNVLKSFAREFPDVVLGLSDHTSGHATVLGAVALGARVVEKHFTDDRTREGPDHGFSLEPDAWRDMVDRTRELEDSLGDENKRVMENERETVVLQRRAIRAARNLPSGIVLTSDDLIMLRPCPPEALPPTRASKLVGRRTLKAITAGAWIDPADVG